MKKFLITDPSHYSSDPRLFAFRLYRAIKRHRPDAVIFRDKRSRNFNQLARSFVRISKLFAIKEIFINQNIKAAISSGASGVHLTSKQHKMITCAKKRGLKVIVSTHSKKEAKMCRRKSVDYILFGPVFYVKEKASPKGLDGLKQIVDNISAKIIALGGITTAKEINMLKQAKPYGFASIRYYTKGI